MSISLKLRDITWLGQAFENTSVLSPFDYIKEDGFTDRDKDRLIESEVIKADGSIAAKQVPLLNTLNMVDRYVNVHVYEELLSMKKSYLFAGPVGLTMLPLNDDLLFQLPSDHSQFGVAIKNILGSSKINNLDFSISLKAQVMKVFSLVCDMYREEAIKKQMIGETLKTYNFEKSQLDQFAENTKENRHQISKHIDVEVKDVEVCLKDLEEKNIIASKDGHYEVDENVLAFAHRYLLNDKVIVVDMGQLEADTVYSSSFRIVQSGSNDIYVIEYSTDFYTITTPSALEVQTIMNNLVGNGPSLIR